MKLNILFKRNSIFTSTYLMAGLLLLLLLLVFLIKDPRHLLRTDKDSPFLDLTAADEVTKIERTIAGKALTLEKLNGVWVVSSRNNTPADQEAVTKILDASIKLERGEIASTNKENRALFKVGESGTHVKLYVGESVLGDFYVGKSGPDFSSTYIRKEGEDYVYLYPKNIRPIISKPELRDLVIFTFNQDQISRIRGEEKSNAITIDKQDGNWKIVEPLKVELTKEKIDPLLTILSNLQATDVVMNLTREEAGITQPTKTITVNAGETQKTFFVGKIVEKVSAGDPTQYYAATDKEEDSRIFVLAEATVKTLPTRIADFEEE